MSIIDIIIKAYKYGNISCYMVRLPYNINTYHKKSCKCVGKPEIHKWRGTASWNIYVLAV